MESAILVGVSRKGEDPRLSEISLQELSRLTETAGARVDGMLAQRLDRYKAGSLIGEGKIREVAERARRAKAGVVVFDENLSPAQQKNLEKAIGAKIIDRTRLILDIFARRARTKEGVLQVELAQLSYLLPRLTGHWRAYSQQVGGIGTRGPGERQLEYERRHIQRRISHLKEAIRHLAGERALQRRRRSAIPVPSIALIGYTNAGKSTLLNRLTSGSKAVYADDKLFATLDPTSRRARLPGGGWAVFTDTVGFISRLPTALIAAFHSTLEEVVLADALLLLEDGASEHLDEQRRTVDAVLKDLGAEAIPRLRVLNKADLLAPERRAALQAEEPDRIFLSAQTGEGLASALGRVEALLEKRWLLRELALPARDQGRWLPLVYGCSQVLSQSLRNDALLLRLRITRENWERLSRMTRERAP